MKAANFAVCALIAFTACVAAMGPRPGGTSPVDVADAGVQSAAKFVLQSANKNECNGLCANINKTGELKLVEVKSATSQVVAGILYNLELIFADEDGNQFSFTASVWNRPWMAAANDPNKPATQITKLSFKELGTLA